MDDGSGEDLVHLLRALVVELDLAAAGFAHEHRLNGTDLRALIALLDAERAAVPATPGWLGERVHLSSASTSALLDRLAERGLLARGPDPADRRRTLVTVTDTARATGRAFFGPLIARVTGSVQDGFDDAEREVLRRMLDALVPGVRDAGHGREVRGGPAVGR